MIEPHEIRRKAEKLYSAFLVAWMADEEFFPRSVPSDRSLPESLTAAAASIQRLRDGSKAALGFGYTIDWKERNSRRHGRNFFPRSIYFESPDDLLRFIGKQKAFSAFTATVQKIRSRHPGLDRWIRANRRAVADAASGIDGLLETVDYFLAHPRPEMFARELPLSVDTKFIERNAGLLRAWLDILLPSSAIVADEEHFARRFGLKYAEPLVHIRFLDTSLPQAASIPSFECAIPLHTMARWEIEAKNVVIVENKTNLLTLPPLAGTLGIFGMGGGVTDLRYVGWLARRHLRYWGDVDVDGFRILSRLRSVFPHVQSFLMDDACLTEWALLIAAPGNGSKGEVLPNLTNSERRAYERCVLNNLRIEQERLPQSYVVDSIASVPEFHI
ncbi:Wadjet anti-phage system protein JetD domain-containing protein [Lacipirellula parvula]|uniref:Wadjet protein JetD C-terminal domain-containing protein n=1 Tax=Lacipirellula parvula TaxID=2650471 RepID=A0A5K7X3I1_9BACT|nr:Wadjet anti-phage system protein JetD domain-containing protein [Lacipirellula parvula]BBO31070.1 hypothetical protein PLANPX_0682 [Lacipirellula parvula]